MILFFFPNELVMRFGLGRGERAYIKILTCENDYFVELREVGDEVVYAWAFCCSPAVFALFLG